MDRAWGFLEIAAQDRNEWKDIVETLCALEHWKEANNNNDDDDDDDDDDDNNNDNNIR